ncbi:hypothetical protein MY5147_006205 [Beauveria neobassiana]
MTEFLGRVEQLAQHNGQHLCLIMDTKDFLKQLRDLRMGGWWWQMGEGVRIPHGRENPLSTLARPVAVPCGRDGLLSRGASQDPVQKRVSRCDGVTEFWYIQLAKTRTNRAAWINAATIAPRPRPSPSPLTLRCQQSDGDEARQK